MKPRALDLFCGAGGATKGLQMAGFHVTGVDHKNQPRYVGECFRIANALSYPLEGFDFIWASPPCQQYSIASRLYRSRGVKYPDVLAATRARLQEQDAPWVIENVPGALNARHRWFEFSLSIPLILVRRCDHDDDPITVCGHGTPSWVREKYPGRVYRQKEKNAAMGIGWMNRGELSQAIPPAYAEFIGKQALRFLGTEAETIFADRGGAAE